MKRKKRGIAKGEAGSPDETAFEKPEVDILIDVIRELERLADCDSRERVMRAVQAFFGL